jgi:hypothetical protein
VPYHDFSIIFSINIQQIAFVAEPDDRHTFFAVTVLMDDMNRKTLLQLILGLANL